MGQTFATIDAQLAEWLAKQHLFFVATAPLGAAGHINCSPKGGDTLRVLGPTDVAYVDGGGSGIETVSHVRENGRLVLMFCAFEGSPRIVRLHGSATVVTPGGADFEELAARLPRARTVRAIIRLAVQRVSDSCGYNVPFMDFRAKRTDAENYLGKLSDDAVRKYLIKNNLESIDSLPGLTPDELKRAVIDRR